VERGAPGNLGVEELVEEPRNFQETSYVELATCCHPICGDEVMGIRLDSDLSGVLVHRLQCDYMLAALHERPVNPKVVGVRWVGQGPTWEDASSTPSPSAMPRHLLEHGPAEAAQEAKRRPCQPGRIAITARDCDGLLSYVTGIVAGLGKSIRRSCTDTDPGTLIATLAFEVLVEDTKELRRILNRLKECEEVMSVRRVGANEGADFFPAPRRTRSTNGFCGVTSGQAKMIEIVKHGGEEMIGAVTGSRARSGGSSDTDADFGHVNDEDYEYGDSVDQGGHRLSSDIKLFEIDRMA
jgi:hypothetical protein